VMKEIELEVEIATETLVGTKGTAGVKLWVVVETSAEGHAARTRSTRHTLRMKLELRDPSSYPLGPGPDMPALPSSMARAPGNSEPPTP
jgi:hypothetical protein